MTIDAPGLITVDLMLRFGCPEDRLDEVYETFRHEPIPEKPSEIIARIRRAVQEVVGNPKDQLIRTLQVEAWDRLGVTMREAANGYWSIGAEHQVWMLLEILAVAPPIPPDEVWFEIYHSGVYDAILLKAGHAPPETACESTASVDPKRADVVRRAVPEIQQTEFYS